MPPRKMIYFSSVHGVGKSSIINELVTKYLINAVPIDNDQYYFYPKEYTDAQLIRIKIGYESFLNTEIPLAITDRGPFDALIYSETLHECGCINDANFETIQKMFHMLPAEYRLSGKIIFLNPSVDRVLKNIRERHRDGELDTIMGDPIFIQKLHDNFARFYQQIQKITDVLIFDNTKIEYTAKHIVEEMQRACWLQPFEVQPIGRLNMDIFGVCSRNDLTCQCDSTTNHKCCCDPAQFSMDEGCRSNFPYPPTKKK